MSRFAWTISAALIAGGCTVLPPPERLMSPADPTAAVPAIRYRAVVDAGPSSRPVGPRDWMDINRDGAPAAPKTPASAQGAKP